MHTHACIKCLHTNVCCLGNGQKEPELCIHRQFYGITETCGRAPMAEVLFVLGPTPQCKFFWRGKKNQEVRRVMKALWGPAMFVSLVSLKVWSLLDPSTNLSSLPRQSSCRFQCWAVIRALCRRNVVWALLWVQALQAHQL